MFIAQKYYIYTQNIQHKHHNKLKLIMFIVDLLIIQAIYSLVILYIIRNQYVDEFKNISLWHCVLINSTLWWQYSKKTAQQDVLNHVSGLITKLYDIFIYNKYTNELVYDEMISVNYRLEHLCINYMSNNLIDAENNKSIFYIKWLCVEDVYIQWHKQILNLIQQINVDIKQNNYNNIQDVLIQLFDIINNWYTVSNNTHNNIENNETIDENDYLSINPDNNNVLQYLLSQQQQQACYIIIRFLGLKYIKYLITYIKPKINDLSYRDISIIFKQSLVI